MHVVIAGCGRVGSQLARDLSGSGHQVVVIDKDRSAFRRLGEDFGGRALPGIVFDRGTLEEAGITRAQAFVAVTSGDNSNIVSARTAKEHYGVSRVVARIYDPSRAKIFERLGVTTVATAQWTAEEISRNLLPAEERVAVALGPGGGEVVVVTLPVPSGVHAVPTERCTLAGRAVVAAVTREGRTSVPVAGGLLEAGDRVHLAVHRDAVDEARALLPQRGVRVIVVGAGNIGRYLAQDLARRGHDLVLIERVPEVLGSVASGGMRVHEGDACSPQVLDRAGAREADVVVAATGDDEDNLVISLLAKQEFAVPRVLARVNHPTNEWMFDQAWGVDLAVSPPHLLTALVEEEVTAGDLVDLLRLEHGAVHLMEVRLDERSYAVGRRVEDLELPNDIVLVAVVRGGHVVACRGSTPLSEGDEVLALVPDGRQEELRDRVIGRR